MGITNQFERKLFFVFGRHIWNIIGVSGFVALMAGSILFVESFSTTNLKSKKQYFGRSYAITLKSEKEYHGRKYVDLGPVVTNIAKDLLKSGKLLDYATWEKEMINKENGYLGFWQNWGGTSNSEYLKYKKQKHRDYFNKITMQNLPAKLLKKFENQVNTYKNYKSEFLKRQEDQQNVYQDYKNEVLQNNSLKLVRRTTSLLPISWGFGVLSVSSVISTIFSIERNTRDTDPE